MSARTKWYLRPLWIGVIALVAGGAGALVRVLWKSDAALTGVLVAATVAYALSTFRLVRAAEDQAAASREQVDALGNQLDEDRSARRDAAKRADDEQLRAEQVFRESIKTQLDARAPTVVVKLAAVQRLIFKREGTRRTGIEERDFDGYDDSIWARVRICWGITNYGPGPAFVFIAHAPGGTFEFERDGTLEAHNRTFVIEPGDTEHFCWGMEQSLFGWRRWEEVGLQPTPVVPDNPRMLDWVFQSQSAFHETLDNHVMRAQLSAFEIDGSRLVARDEATIVNAWSAASITRTYPGLDVIPED